MIWKPEAAVWSLEMWMGLAWATDGRQARTNVVMLCPVWEVGGGRWGMEGDPSGG